MTVKILKPKKIEKLNTDYINDAISNYIKKSGFPKRSELNKYLATKAYYNEKVKQHNSIFLQASKDQEIIQTKTDILKLKNAELLNSLRNNL
jgi:hypothetical protein